MQTSTGQKSPQRRRLLIIADFAVSEDRDRGPRALAGRVVDDILERWRPALPIRAANRLQGRRSEPIDATLAWGCLEDFGPAALVRSLSLLAEFAAARRELEAAGSGTSEERDTLGERLPASLRNSDLGSRLPGPSSPVDSGDDAVSNLLSQVALPTEAATDELAELCHEIDRRLTRQIAALLEIPRLQAVETAWRCLDFLLTRVPESVDIELLSATKDDFLETFFETAFQLEYDGKTETPLLAVVLGFPFERSPSDLERLRHAATMGQSLNVPFLASIGPSYFGLKRLAMLPSLPDLPGRCQGADYIKWNALRDHDASLWLALGTNRFLLRDGWAAGEATDAAGFRWIDELGGGAGEPLWGESAWALALLLGQALEQAGLALPMTAIDVEGLACRPFGGRRGAPFPYPLEARVDSDKALEVAQCGLFTLVAEPGHGQTQVPYLPTYHRPRSYTTEAATRSSYQAATLPYQVFASLASLELQHIARTLPGAADDDTLQRHFGDGFAAFLGLDTAESLDTAEEPNTAESQATADAEPAVLVEVERGSGIAGDRELTVRLRPAFEVCGGPVDLVLGLQLPG